MQPRGRNTASVRNRNKAAVQHMFDCFNSGDVDALAGFVSPDVANHNPPPRGAAGLQGIQEQICYVRQQFPDAWFEVEGMVAEADVVFARWRMSGTNTGPIYGRPPTGRRIVHRGVEAMRLRGGKVVEHYDTSDLLGFLDKLGLLDQEMLQLLQHIGARAYAGDLDDGNAAGAAASSDVDHAPRASVAGGGAR